MAEPQSDSKTSSSADAAAAAAAAIGATARPTGWYQIQFIETKIIKNYNDKAVVW